MKTGKLIQGLTGRREKKQIKAVHELEELMLKGELELDEDTIVTAIPFLIESLDNDNEEVSNIALSILELIADLNPVQLTNSLPQLITKIDESYHFKRMVMKSIKGIALFHPDVVYGYMQLLVNQLTDQNADIVEIVSSIIIQLSTDKPDEVSDILLKYFDSSDESLNVRVFNIFKTIYDSHHEYAQQLPAILNYFITNQKHEQIIFISSILSESVIEQPSIVKSFLPQLTEYLNLFGNFWAVDGRLITSMLMEIVNKDQPDSVKSAVSYLLKNLRPICNGTNPCLYANGMMESIVSTNPDCMGTFSPLLIKWLNSSHTTPKMYASILISNVGLLRPNLLRETIDPLIACLDDAQQGVRYNAIIAIDAIGKVKPLYIKSAFDKLTNMSENDPDMRTKKSAHDALMHLSGINSINDALLDEYNKFVRKHVEVSTKIDKLKNDLENGDITDVDYSYWTNVTNENLNSIEGAIKKTVEKQIKMYGYIHDNGILMDDLTCINDIKDQMGEIKTEWLNERISLDEYEKRLDFIRVILLYIMAHSVHTTSDDIEFLESRTSTNALVIRSLQKELDERKQKILI